jgi:hypothetical protein
MEITRQFQYDLPDDYLSSETTLGLKADWTYTGPDKIWVFVDKKTNKLIREEGFIEYCDEIDYEKQFSAMDRRAGLGSYTVIIEFEKDPLLIAAIAVPPPEMKDMEVKNYYHHETGEWIYARPNPTTPCHTIEIGDCEYDLEKKEWKKPYPWKKPHRSRDEYVNGYNNKLAYEQKIDTSKFSKKQKELWQLYLSESERHLIKFERYLDTPWMIKEPENPMVRDDWDNL